jgi:hypothetical protein
MAKEGFLGALGRIASQFADGAPEGPRNVLFAIGPWINDLTRNATQHWLPQLLLGIPCEVVYRDAQTQIGVPCSSPAIAACCVCRKPVCLDHSFVSRMGQAACFGCIQQGITDHAPKIPWPAGTRGNPTDPRAAPGGQTGAAGAPPKEPPPGAPPPPNPVDVRIAAARKTLRVKRSATFAEVQVAYKREALKWHPDRNGGNPDAKARFIAATAAYDLLKKAYDQ